MTMVVVALLALAIALTETKHLIAILMFSFTLRAGGAFFPYILGHYWKRASAWGAMASLILGSLTVVAGEKGWLPLGDIEPILPGLSVSLVVFVLASILRPGAEGTSHS